MCINRCVFGSYWLDFGSFGVDFGSFGVDLGWWCVAWCRLVSLVYVFVACVLVCVFVCVRLSFGASIAQLGERQTEDLKVPGSIPGRGNLCPFSLQTTDQTDATRHHGSDSCLPTPPDASRRLLMQRYTPETVDAAAERASTVAIVQWTCHGALLP